MRVEDGSWPVLDDPRDPWREAWPDDDLGWHDLTTSDWVEPRAESVYRRQALDLQAHLDALRAGGPFDAALLIEKASTAGISAEWRPDRRPPHRAPYRVDEHLLLRVANDYEPAAGLFGTDSVLGPWVETLDPESADGRRLLAYAVAHWACCHTTERSPYHAYDVAEPVPTARDRAAVRAIERAPLSVWIARRGHEGWRLTDLAGLHRRRLPDAPVDLDHAAGPGRLEDGAAILARAVPVEGAWHAWGPIVLPAVPRPDQVRAWVLVELVAARIRRRRDSLEDALRARGHHFARAALLWAYGAGPSE